VVGCSYTAVSFAVGSGRQTPRRLIVGFMILSLIVTLALKWLGVQPTRLLIAAGTINGILMPVILGVVLLAAYRPSLMGNYRHPWWAGALGVVAWLVSLFLAYRTAVMALS
jgi:Mn2+/Fe2+ NRAMP family transporter